MRPLEFLIASIIWLALLGGSALILLGVLARVMLGTSPGASQTILAGLGLLVAGALTVAFMFRATRARSR